MLNKDVWELHVIQLKSSIMVDNSQKSRVNSYSDKAVHVSTSLANNITKY